MATPIKLEKTFEIDLDQNGETDIIHLQAEGDVLTISAEMNPSQSSFTNSIMLFSQKMKSIPFYFFFPQNSPIILSKPDIALPNGASLNLKTLFQERKKFITFFESRRSRLEELKQQVTDLSKNARFTAKKAVDVLTEIKELSNEQSSMARYHQYSNDSPIFRKLGEKYYIEMEEYSAHSVLLNSDYRALVTRVKKNRLFSQLDEETQNWVEETISKLAKRTVSALEKKEYTTLIAQEIEQKDLAEAAIKQIEDNVKYPISLSDFNRWVEDGEFKKAALKDYEKKDDKIYLPASEVFNFVGKCTNKKLRNQVWKTSAKDLKKASEKAAYNILLGRARRAEILGWNNFAEYELQQSALGNLTKVKKGLAEISSIYKPLAAKEIASLQKEADRDHTPLDVADSIYHDKHRSNASSFTIPDDKKPEFKNVLSEFHNEMLSLMKGKISKIEEVDAEQFTKDMPDISLWTDPKYLIFYKFYDQSNNYVGYKIIDPFKRENKYPSNSAWDIKNPRPDGKFLMIITTGMDLKGKHPQGRFPLDLYQLKTHLHEGGHGINETLRKRLSKLPSDGVEVPSIATETYFALNRAFLRKILPPEHVETAYKFFSNLVDNPVGFNERLEFAVRNINYHSFSYKKLKALKNMEAVEKIIHADRKRYSLFSPENPDDDSFIEFHYMFYSAKSDLHRYIIVNHLQKRIIDTCEKVGYDNPQLKNLLMDYFIVPDAKRSRQPLFDKLKEFEREASNLTKK